MKSSRENKKQRPEHSRCRALCCSCRVSVSSSEEAESSNSDCFPSVSILAHAMVQEKLDQMIKERQEARHREKRKQRSHGGTKFIVMVAMEKCSYDAREDFRESMVEMIMANRIEDPKDLRRQERAASKQIRASSCLEAETEAFLFGTQLGGLTNVQGEMLLKEMLW
ncbi:transcription repressor OFP9 [Tripterygium wilfordii]|uniref:Transcription repressor n=1 Tax=Tripterygium wilfordii TaxID=458696 RepID=A0A7J7C329_TRIWF|nr:transcription repressor OFP9 [Tripterygium wilfordii]